jgi:hypothetical protein
MSKQHKDKSGYDESRVIVGHREIYDYQGNKEFRRMERNKIVRNRCLKEFIQDYREYLSEFEN